MPVHNVHLTTNIANHQENISLSWSHTGTVYNVHLDDDLYSAGNLGFKPDSLFSSLIGQANDNSVFKIVAGPKTYQGVGDLTINLGSYSPNIGNFIIIFFGGDFADINDLSWTYGGYQYVYKFWQLNDTIPVQTNSGGSWVATLYELSGVAFPPFTGDTYASVNTYANPVDVYLGGYLTSTNNQIAFAVANTTFTSPLTGAGLINASDGFAISAQTTNISNIHNVPYLGIATANITTFGYINPGLQFSSDFTNQSIISSLIAINGKSSISWPTVGTPSVVNGPDAYNINTLNFTLVRRPANGHWVVAIYDPLQPIFDYFGFPGLPPLNPGYTILPLEFGLDAALTIGKFWNSNDTNVFNPFVTNGTFADSGIIVFEIANVNTDIQVGVNFYLNSGEFHDVTTNIPVIGPPSTDNALMIVIYVDGTTLNTMPGFITFPFQVGPLGLLDAAYSTSPTHGFNSRVLPFQYNFADSTTDDFAGQFVFYVLPPMAVAPAINTCCYPLPPIKNTQSVNSGATSFADIKLNRYWVMYKSNGVPDQIQVNTASLAASATWFPTLNQNTQTQSVVIKDVNNDCVWQPNFDVWNNLFAVAWLENNYLGTINVKYIDFPVAAPFEINGPGGQMYIRPNILRSGPLVATENVPLDNLYIVDVNSNKFDLSSYEDLTRGFEFDMLAQPQFVRFVQTFRQPGSIVNGLVQTAPSETQADGYFGGYPLIGIPINVYYGATNDKLYTRVLTDAYGQINITFPIPGIYLFEIELLNNSIHYLQRFL
jgi:hypothetical protein